MEESVKDQKISMNESIRAPVSHRLFNQKQGTFKYQRHSRWLRRAGNRALS